MFEEYVKGLGGSKEVLEWVRTALKSYISTGTRHPNGMYQADIEHVLDYLMSSAAPKRLRKMSYEQAKIKADAWSKTQQKKGNNVKETAEDTQLVHDFLDGTRIVKLLSKQALQREGFLMSHCVGGYDASKSTIYSYRDAKNQPHATFEVGKEGEEIVQIKGKGNGPIHPKHVHPILAFLKTIGMDIRPSDMINLGYAHIPADALDVVNMFETMDGKKAPITVIAGESYIFVGL